ncbi:tumor protein p63-regulated gene 1 protein isoform X2 [Scleropages formosus]|nr:tumor protein p63-regulated gene 1-like protein isoform X2 [Scleropages formosus]
MSEGEDGSFRAVELGENTAGPSHPTPESPPQAAPPVQSEPTHEPPETAEQGSSAARKEWVTALSQFKLKRFFVLRPGTLEHALEDIRALVNQQEDGDVQSVWLLAEVDHWNNERERVVMITDNTLVICKYDFMMFNCEQILKVPLNFVDRVSHGAFVFPPRSLLSREGRGLRIFWDRMREPSFSSRWNPFAKDYPFATFTYHPVRNADEKFAALCELDDFREQLVQACQNAHAKEPVPGKANGVIVLNQPLVIEAYVGLMSFIGNQNKLGYCLARGNIGF